MESETLQVNTATRTSVLSALYLAAAIACLIQWRWHGAWSRIDLFSGGYLILRASGTVHSFLSAREAYHSRQLRREWWGVTSNTGGVKWVILLMAGDLMVFMDYGHWHLAAWLEQPALQEFGLGLYACVAVWQIWTDVCLAGYFASAQAGRTPMETGAFRYVRHPRYSGAIVGKIAFALVFASLLGWLLAFAWFLLLLRNAATEEVHLRKLFGTQYEAYARRTARLLPRIY